METGKYFYFHFPEYRKKNGEKELIGKEFFQYPLFCSQKFSEKIIFFLKSVNFDGESHEFK